MAFVEYIPADQPGSSMPYFFNVTNSVGNNASNQQEDVMLVQFLLQELYRTVPYLKFRAMRRPTPEDIAVDGWFGPQTLKWILHFQEGCVNSGCYVVVDGRVDRAYGMNSASTGSTYTIVLLNHELYRYNPLFWSVDAMAHAPWFLSKILARGGAFMGR